MPSPSRGPAIDLPHLVLAIDDVLAVESGGTGITLAVAGVLPRFLDNPSAIGARHMEAVAEDRYARNLLYRDPRKRYVILVLVWGPGHATPVHDHDSWGIVGILEGAITETRFELVAAPPGSARVQLRRTAVETFGAGEVCRVDPPERDLHCMCNSTCERSVTVHVYGGEARECNVYRGGSVARKRMEYDYSVPMLAV